MPARPTDPDPFTQFAAALNSRDPATVAAYLTTLRGLHAWLKTRPGCQTNALDSHPIRVYNAANLAPWEVAVMIKAPIARQSGFAHRHRL